MLSSIDQRHKNQIETIMKGMKCQEDFACYKAGFKNICQVKETVEGKVFECCDTRAERCGYSVPFGDNMYCTCPLRTYVMAHLGV